MITRKQAILATLMCAWRSQGQDIVVDRFKTAAFLRIEMPEDTKIALELVIGKRRKTISAKELMDCLEEVQ